METNGMASRLEVLLLPIPTARATPAGSQRQRCAHSHFTHRLRGFPGAGASGRTVHPTL